MRGQYYKVDRFLFSSKNKKCEQGNEQGRPCWIRGQGYIRLRIFIIRNRTKK